MQHMPEVKTPLYRPGATASNWPALVADLNSLSHGLDQSATARSKAAADYHWYSPVLAERLAGRLPQGVVRPTDVAEVVQIAAACARHQVPLTVRGGGTGNYGQCVPLFGGLTLDTTALNQVLLVQDGYAVVQAGALMGAINDTVRHSGQQLRMWPSTERIATLGGFIAGGHSGIGSMRHGILADPGNVRRLRVVTLQDPPQVIDLLGAYIQKAHHAYGSNGIVVEVEVALTAYVPWQHTMAVFDSYAAVLNFGLAAGAASVRGELDIFQLSAVERRITPYYARCDVCAGFAANHTRLCGPGTAARWSCGGSG
jgi:FAD/FMN-containing dehydrogenase